MRKEVTDRYYKVYTYQPVDRIADFEFGYWPQTLRRWLREGMPVQLTPAETEDCFNAKVDAHFGLDQLGYRAGFVWKPYAAINPPFEERIIERREKSVVAQDAEGCIAERYQADSDESSIPHYIKFPVETPDDWKAFKQRYRVDDPIRKIRHADVTQLRQAIAAGRMITCATEGFYAQLRSWMGFENLSVAFFDHPDMIHDMVDHWVELNLSQINALPPDILIDQADWWEDMSGRNGPFVGPNMFREFLQPGYKRIMDALKKRGCKIGVVDTDGNPHDIIRNFMEEGVNIMFPLEVAAGVDPYAWRKEFGKQLRLRGGIAKGPIIEGGKAIDRELDRIRPLLEQGGYIPHLDHLVPPDVSYRNYCEYREKKQKLLGKK